MEGLLLWGKLLTLAKGTNGLVICPHTVEREYEYDLKGVSCVVNEHSTCTSHPSDMTFQLHSQALIVAAWAYTPTSTFKSMQAQNPSVQ